MTSISRFLRRFGVNTRGNVVITLALSLPVIALAIGGGVDFANVLNAKARLQDATDSGAIAAALDSAGTLDTQKVAAKKAFDSNLAGSDLKTTALASLKVSTSGTIQTMNYSSTATVKTYLLGMINMPTVAISAIAKAGVSINSAEIVFVLDNTGSMSSNGKMDALKTSLDTTLASLLDANGNNVGKTKVALVPFDTQVSLSGVAGMVNYAGNFTTVNPVYACTTLSAAQCTAVVSNYSTMCGSTSGCADNQVTYTRSWTSNGKTYYGIFSQSYYKTGYTYTYNRNTYNYYYALYRQVVYKVASDGTMTLYSTDSNGGYAYDSGYAYNKPDYYTKYTGTISYTTPSAGGYDSTSTVVIKDNNTITSNDDLLGVSTGNWSGCVIDRVQSYDVTSDAPVSTNTNTLYPAAKCATNSLLPIMDLTQNIADARTYAKKMKPAGNTNITIGIQWGMEVLSPSAPFTQGAAFTDTTVNKYMIILTDGANTQNRWTTTAATINARTALACTNAKALGITIFTIRLEAGDSDMLSKCASNTGYYYNLTSASQINGALGGIMKSIKKVRLTQ